MTHYPLEWTLPGEMMLAKYVCRAKFSFHCQRAQLSLSSVLKLLLSPIQSLLLDSQPNSAIIGLLTGMHMHRIRNETMVDLNSIPIAWFQIQIWLQLRTGWMVEF